MEAHNRSMVKPFQAAYCKYTKLANRWVDQLTGQSISALGSPFESNLKQ